MKFTMTETGFNKDKMCCDICNDCGNFQSLELPEDNLGEECGVFGIYDLDGNNVAASIYYGLFALQHRGQESCGIAVSDTQGPPRKIQVCKGMGLVNEVFQAEHLDGMKGDIGVGHVR